MKHGDQIETAFLVSDEDDERLAVVRHLLDRRARVEVVAASAVTPNLQTERYAGVALAGLRADPAADDPGLDFVRAIAQRGLTVVAYAAGASSWRLGSRCHALLAGASRLLDSSSAQFAIELTALVDQLLSAAVRRAEQQTRVRALLSELGVIGESRAMLEVFAWVQKVGPLSDLPTLITGETGTGKQLLAEAIHRLDPKRRAGPFVPINCGAISPGVAESELFGHRRGAFTGADRDRRGLVRAAHGGVLFLDEVGELEESLQTKLLRVLQEGRVLALGEDQEIPVSVRVIAATNRDLVELVRQRRFRADLFYRLNVLSLCVPPLRERLDDVAPLVEHFVAKHGSLNPAIAPTIAGEFVEALQASGLPGNARQLENIVRRALVQKDDDGPLGLRDLPAEIWRQVSEQAGAAVAPRPALAAGAHSPIDVLQAHDWNLSRSLDYFERALLEAALRMTRGNQSRTARLLGITPRSVYNKVRRHRLAS
jgi:DNA-binding NtrC family response regulator